MTDYSTTASNQAKSGLRFKHLFLIVLLTFLAGGGAAVWAAYHFGYVKTDTPAAVTPPPATPSVANVQPVAPAPASANQVGQLEDRMDAINNDAEAASGNATKAEALLIAFAARRALDGGQPLGYVAGQLQQRFGNSQPQAVATIITAAQTPVTKDKLHSELAALEGALTTGNARASAWDRFKREMSELFVLRKAGARSAAPSEQMQRALAAVDSGNVKAAIAEVQAMPGKAAATGWLSKARQYADARKALDSIESAAIQSGSVAPAPAPVTTSPVPAPQPANPTP